MKIKIIPNILEREGRSEREVVWSIDKSISDYLRDENIDITGHRIIVSGKAETDLSVKIKQTDEIIITPKIEDPFTLGTLIFTALSLSSIVPIGLAYATVMVLGYLAVAGIGIGISLLTNALFAPRRPSFGGGGLGSTGLDSNSPTYGWDGVQTQQNVGTPVPIIYGEHKVGGNIINQYVSNNGDKNYLHMLIALSEGEIQSVSNILINDNEIANFDSVESIIKLGTNTQDPIPDFANLHEIYSVQVNLDVKDDSHVYLSSGTQIEGFDVLLVLPGGLYQINQTKGTNEAWEIQFKIEYKIHSDSTYTTLGTYKINEKNRSPLRRSYKKTGLTPGQYDIKVTRLSVAGDDFHVGNLTFNQIDEIIAENLSYPNTALLGLDFLASDQLSGSSPNVTAVVKGRKVSVPNILTSEGGTAVPYDDYYYDEDADSFRLFSTGGDLYWDEETFISAFSANPCWCIRDLIVNKRYGIGEFVDVSHIDETLFLLYAKYCDGKVADGKGGYEKRFRLDMVIDSFTRALDAIYQLSSTFRAIFFFSDNSVKVKIDKLDTIDQVFSMGNIVSDSFAQSWKSTKEDFNVIEVQFLDKDRNYEQSLISYIDEESIASGEPLRKKTVRLFCTRVSQAMREARFLLNSCKYLNRSITFKASINAIAVQSGDLIGVSHDVPQWGFSGRIASYDSGTGEITLDQEITMAGGISYYLQVRHSDDILETKEVITVAGTTNKITLASPFSFDPEYYDVFSFGTIATISKPFRLMSIIRSSSCDVDMVGIEYNESIYDDSAPALPTQNYSELVNDVPPIPSIILSEHIVKTGDGTIENAIDVWFEKPQQGVYTRIWEKGKIYLSDDGGLSWSYKGETTDGKLTIIGGLSDLIEYTIKITSVSYDGKESSFATAPTSIINLIGKSALPGNVSGFIVRQSRDRMAYYWLENTDVDLFGYEIRRGSSWDSGVVIASGISQTSFFSLSIIAGASQNYWIKAIDTSGNYSETPTQAIITIDNVPFTNIIESFSEQTAWGGTKTDVEISGDNLIVSDGKLSGTYLCPIRDVGYIATFKIGIDGVCVVSGDSTWQDFGEQTFQDIPDSLRFLGAQQSGALSYEIRISDDNSIWSDWEAWIPSDYKCRYFQIRMTITRASTSIALICSVLDYYADLPDVDEVQNVSISNASAGIDVTFLKTFHEIPAINVTVYSGSGIYHVVSSLSVTGVNIKIYNSAGTAQTGNLIVHIHGV